VVVTKRRHENRRKRGLVFISRSYEKPSMNNCNPQINEEAVTTTAIKGIGQFSGGCENQGRLNRKI
jgi:hypothetical protein